RRPVAACTDTHSRKAPPSVATPYLPSLLAHQLPRPRPAPPLACERASPPSGVDANLDPVPHLLARHQAPRVGLPSATAPWECHQTWQVDQSARARPRVRPVGAAPAESAAAPPQPAAA